MSPERYQQVKRLFDAVSPLPEGERMARLRQLESDETLIAEVAALLAAGAATTHLSGPLSAALAEVVAPKLHAGDQLGVWRIEREIGAGGMGSVFLVERSDGHFKQRAALKFLKGVPRSETLAYFTRERQLLASLSHPNVSRLLDGGATEQGQPYLVMEYIDGEHIDVYCREKKLGVTEILKLFAVACEAVAFAHRELVVHCDLKPSNLLVDRAGRPVLLDFGIARLAGSVDDPIVAAGGEPRPSKSASPFTPRYASPEQLNNGPVATASDIYSLGVLLNELLTAASDRDQYRGLRDAELHAIHRRATQTDPAGRYITVDAFIEDLRRFAAQQPLRAMDPAPSYLAQKFLVRRWPAVLAGLTFVVMAAGFTVKVVIESQHALTAEQAARAAEQSALQQRDRAQAAEQQALKERDATALARADAVRERDRATGAEHATLEQRNLAVSERDKARAAQAQAVTERNRAVQSENAARQTNEFLVSVFASSDPTAEIGDPPASKLLAAAEARLEKELKGQPATQADLYGTLASVQVNMGHPEAGLKDYERAIEIERPLNRPLVLAALLSQMAELRTESFGEGGAEPYAREALALYEANSPPNSTEVALALSSLAGVLSALNKVDAATPLYQRAIAIIDAQPNPDLRLGDVYIRASHHELHQNEYAKAVALMERGMQFAEKRFGKGQPEYLHRQEEYVRALREARRFADAEPIARSIVEQRRNIHGNESDNVAQALVGLSQVLQGAGKIREAIPILKEAAEIRGKHSGTDSLPYVIVLNNLASCYLSVGNFAGAEATFAEAVRSAEKQLKPEEAGMLTLRFNLARSQIEQRKFEAALPTALSLVEINLRQGGPKHTRTLEAQTLLLEIYVGLRRADEAVAVHEILKQAQPMKEVLNTLRYQRLSAQLAVLQGRKEDALKGFEQLEATGATTYGADHYRTWLLRAYRADFLASLGDEANRKAGADLAAQVIAKITPFVDPEAGTLIRMRKLLLPQN